MLLKYVSRDTVELLGSGKTGVSEARAELAQYQDKSPLYGLIIFRRRKVLIKYIPEGTSRLLQGMSDIRRLDIPDSHGHSANDGPFPARSGKVLALRCPPRA